MSDWTTTQKMFASGVALMAIAIATTSVSGAIFFVGAMLAGLAIIYALADC